MFTLVFSFCYPFWGILREKLKSLLDIRLCFDCHRDKSNFFLNSFVRLNYNPYTKTSALQRYITFSQRKKYFQRDYTIYPRIHIFQCFFFWSTFNLFVCRRFHEKMYTKRLLLFLNKKNDIAQVIISILFNTVRNYITSEVRNQIYYSTYR